MSKQYDHVIEVSDVTTEGDMHSVSIKVDDRVYAKFTNADKDILVNNARDIAHVVNFAVAFGVDEQIEVVLNSGEALTDMYSAGSLACSSVLGCAEGVQMGIIKPQDGSPMWGTLVIDNKALDGKQVTEAARMVFADFNGTKDKSSFNLPASATKAVSVVTAEGWEPELKLGAPASPAPEEISDVEKQ